MPEAIIHIETTKLTAPNLARLFIALNTFHIAAALADDQRNERLADALRRRFEPHMGGRAIGDDDRLLTMASEINSTSIEEIVAPIEVIQLRSGSIDTRIREILEGIFRHLREILRRLPSIAPPASSQLVRDVIDDVLSTMEHEVPDRDLLRTVLYVGMMNAQVALKSMEAGRVVVSEVFDLAPVRLTPG
jgi:hypothetical protein